MGSERWLLLPAIPATLLPVTIRRARLTASLDSLTHVGCHPSRSMRPRIWSKRLRVR